MCKCPVIQSLKGILGTTCWSLQETINHFKDLFTMKGMKFKTKSNSVSHLNFMNFMSFMVDYFCALKGPLLPRRLKEKSIACSKIPGAPGPRPQGTRRIYIPK